MNDKRLPTVIDQLPAVSSSDFLPVLQIEQAVERYNAVTNFVKTVMRPQVDFGTIPGVDKPTLLQPGAEKLIALFGLTPMMEVVDKIEDWTGRDHGGETFFYYRVRCTMMRGQRVLGVEEASANSWESKHRYRWVSVDQVPLQLDPQRLPKRDSSITEFAFAVRKAETAGRYGKPAEYWARFQEAQMANKLQKSTQKSKGGKDLEAWTIPSVQYRIPNQDTADLVNTLIQMAEKRAKIRATRSCTGASEFFTQDVEDMELLNVPKAAAASEPHDADQPPPPKASAPSAPSERIEPQSPADGGGPPPEDDATVPPAAGTFNVEEGIANLKTCTTLVELTTLFNAFPIEHRRPGTAAFQVFKDMRETLMVKKEAA